MNQQHEGIGGSYSINEAGERVLLGRTDEFADAIYGDGGPAPEVAEVTMPEAIEPALEPVEWRE